jgi:hypothetical protein
MRRKWAVKYLTARCGCVKEPSRIEFARGGGTGWSACLTKGCATKRSGISSQIFLRITLQWVVFNFMFSGEHFNASIDCYVNYGKGIAFYIVWAERLCISLCMA